jgi:hypothetical protein
VPTKMIGQDFLVRLGVGLQNIAKGLAQLRVGKDGAKRTV